MSEYEKRQRRSNLIGYLILGVAFVLVIAFCNEPYQGGAGGADDGCPDSPPLIDICVPTHEVCDVIEGERFCWRE